MHDSGSALPMRRVLETWWPLAASWLLMSIELPVISAFIARLENPEIHLASYGAVIFPIALVVEAPVIMLLAASTALSRDWDSYRALRKYMMVLGGGMTLLHLLVALTPLYGLVVATVMGPPLEVASAARSGLLIMTPWTWSIAYRRLNQGVLIRFGHSRAVGVGTILRLIADLVILGIGLGLGSWSGTVVATSAVAAGVVVEALYVGLRVRPVLTTQVRLAQSTAAPLTTGSFLHFYVPLALTSFLNLIIQPFGSAALSRMPFPLESLAVWPVLTGFTFLFRSLGLAYQEVVVALLDEVGGYPTLHRFTWLLTASTTLGLLLFAVTPLSSFWFETVSGLSSHLAELAGQGLWLAVLLPGLSVMRNWYQGILVHRRQTRSITASVGIFLVACGGMLWLGANRLEITGLFVAVVSFTLGGILQALWVGWKSRLPRAVDSC